MAEEKKEENGKKGGLIKIIMMAVGGIVLLGVGLGIGMFMGGEKSDPSSEISQIIEITNCAAEIWPQGAPADGSCERKMFSCSTG